MLDSKNLIFDLDGTLWDALDCVVSGWNRVLEDMGRANAQFEREDLSPYVGKSRPDIFRALFPMLSDEEKAAFNKEATEAMLASIQHDGAKIYHGIKETIDSLHQRDYTLAIVSNCQIGYIDLFLEQTQTTDIFIDQECYGATLKPKSENITALMARNNMKDAIYIGDTRTDQAAAAEAGLPFIFCSYGFGELDYSLPWLASIRKPTILSDLIAQGV